MRKLLVTILAAGMLLSLAACGGGDSASKDPNLGKYIGYEVNVLDWTPISEVYPGENYIELTAGGKGTFCLDGDSTSIQWTMDGEDLTLTAEGEDCLGTIKDGVMSIDFFGMGIQMTFVKEGASVTESETSAPASGETAETTETATLNGRFDCTGSEYNGVKMDPAGEWIEFEDATRGTVCIAGTEYPFTWSMSGNEITINEDVGVSYTATFDNGVITLDTGMLYFFE